MNKLKMSFIAIALLAIGIAIGSLVFPRKIRSFSAVGYVTFPEDMEFSQLRSFSSVLAKFDLRPSLHGDGPNGTTNCYDSENCPNSSASVFTGIDSVTREEITIIEFVVSAPTKLESAELARELTLELQNIRSK